jgi:hypothetical protein
MPYANAYTNQLVMHYIQCYMHIHIAILNNQTLFWMLTLPCHGYICLLNVQFISFIISPGPLTSVPQKYNLKYSPDCRFTSIICTTRNHE